MTAPTPDTPQQMTPQTTTPQTTTPQTTTPQTTTPQTATPYEIVGRPIASPAPWAISDGEHRLIARIQEQERLATRVDDTVVRGPRKQSITVREAKGEVARLKSIISLDEDRFAEQHNSLRHRLVPDWMKNLILAIVIFVDYPIMLYMSASIFDVDWSDPFGIRLLISAVVALLATGGAAAALHHLGHEHREHKNDQGQLEWTSLTMSAKATLAAVALLLLLIGWSSYWRIYTEGMLSGSDLAVLLALLVAVVLVISAWLIYRTAFKDGSVLTDDLQQLSKTVNHYSRVQRDHEDRAAALRHQLAMIQRREGPDPHHKSA